LFGSPRSAAFRLLPIAPRRVDLGADIVNGRQPLERTKDREKTARVSRRDCGMPGVMLL
jgi:hypothetical protein